MPTAHRRIAKSERKTPAGRSQPVDGRRSIALLAKTAATRPAPRRPAVDDDNRKAPPSSEATAAPESKAPRQSVGLRYSAINEPSDKQLTPGRRYAMSDADAPPAVKPEGQPVVEDQNTDAGRVMNTALRAEVDATFRQSANLRQAITENLAPLRAKAAKASERVKKAFEDWNPVQLSEEDRNRGLYVPPDKDTSKTLKTVLESSVGAMRTADTGGAIRLRNSRELKQITKHPRNGAGSAQGLVELGRLVDLLYAKRTAYSLVSIPVYTRCKAELEAEEVLSKVAKTAEDESVNKSAREGPAKARETAQYVKDSVHRQMDPATAPEARFEYGTVPKIPNASNEDEAQKKLLSTFQLRPGPSDVTSYHDFHTLQIAFANVWTKLFDGELEALGRELYTNYVDLKEFTGSADPDIKVSTLNDLRRLMAEIRKLSQFVQEDIPVSLRPEGSGQTTTGVTVKPEDVLKGAGALATGGASLFIEWAINELVKLGNRPVKVKWANFPLKLNEPKGNIIELQPPEQNGAYPGTVEIALETDANSFKKRIVFQQWDADTGRPIYNAELQNFGAGHAGERGPSGTIVDRLLLNPAQLASGTLKFISEDEILNEVLLGRYVLGDLAEVLKERTKVTFRWKGQR
jgi:hypothetical protein